MQLRTALENGDTLHFLFISACHPCLFLFFFFIYLKSFLTQCLWDQQTYSNNQHNLPTCTRALTHSLHLSFSNPWFLSHTWTTVGKHIHAHFLLHHIQLGISGRYFRVNCLFQGSRATTWKSQIEGTPLLFITLQRKRISSEHVSPLELEKQNYITKH